MIDLGMAGKVRPAVIVSREDTNSPRALSVAVPLSSENRGSKYEVKMPRVPWLRLQSFANVQAINSVEHHELLDKRGKFEPAVLRQIRDAIQWGDGGVPSCFHMERRPGASDVRYWAHTLP